MRNRNFKNITWKYDSPEFFIRDCVQLRVTTAGVLFGFLFAILISPDTTMASSDLAKVTSGNALFANKFYDIISKEKGNVFFSPLSAHTVLAMAYQGAAGETAKQFASTLNIPDQKVAASGYNNVMSSLNSIENVTLHIANKIFVMQNYPLKAAFKKAVTESFLSETESVNFAANVAAAQNINQWVEKKTNSKIRDLITADCLNALTRLVLVNAVYFKGDWQHKFSKEATRTEPFYLTANDKADCKMMHIKRKFNYREDEALDAKILELPYNNQNVSMVVILPNAIDGIANLESKLMNVDLSTLTQQMRYVEVEVALPKFKIETTMDLNDVLAKMGLDLIFNEHKADFSEISESDEQLYVSKVIQKAFIEVNEEGAEAAAATGMIMMTRSMPIFHPPKEFIADHPFILTLLHKQESASSVLFYGRVNKPSI